MKIPTYNETICPLCSNYEVCNHCKFKTKVIKENYNYIYCEEYTRKGEINYENNRQNNG